MEYWLIYKQFKFYFWNKIIVRVVLGGPIISAVVANGVITNPIGGASVVDKATRILADSTQRLFATLRGR